MIKLKVEPITSEKAVTEAVAILVYEDDKEGASYRELDKKLGGKIASLIKQKKFVPKKMAVRSIDSMGKIKPDSVILVGLGKKEAFSEEILRRASAKAASAAAGVRAKSLTIAIDPFITTQFKAEELAQAMAEGLILSTYSFAKYGKKEEDVDDESKLNLAVIAQRKDTAKGKRGVAVAQNVCYGVYLARDLQNHAGNIATPTFIANAAKKECAKAGVRCKVLGKREIEKLKMGSFLAVAKGSAQEPKFLIMEHMKGPKSEKPFVLVGKGLTFDSGGISLKPSANMEDMKFDMSGGAAVIGTMVATGLLKTRKNIVGLVPLTENMPGGRANKPGDVITASDGQTIEVLNTDAEGRLILADALVYAKRYKPAKVVDLATLTGAIVISLGHQATGLFGNDQKLIDKIIASGEKTGERCWQFPMWEEYEEMIKSKIANVKNVGERGAGSITAAAFLKKFTDYPWAHLDIAGTADNAKPTAPYNTPGGTGIGIRLLLDLINK
ncbi:MAG: leucyl aminopeptidase [Nitrospinota bacterium]|nr:leucyl aminopeptidase [Nitrospinota bacterium]